MGELEIEIKLEASVLPGTVFVSHGWGKLNANTLADDENLDPISGFPLLRSIPCSIEKKSAV